jgi:glucose/arabinose dehydrogenase
MVQLRAFEYTFPGPVKILETHPMQSLFLRPFYFLLPLLLSACSGAEVQGDAYIEDPAKGVELHTVVSGLDQPWGMDFLPNGEMLVTEKSGRLLRIDPATGEMTAIGGVPEVREVGQGGLLDVLVDPDFSSNHQVYLSYVIAGEGGYTTRIARGELRGTALQAVQVLFTAQPYYDTGRHFGSRLLIHDSFLYFSVGDRGKRHGAQDLSTHNGKVMRLHPDGRIPADNPFVGREGARPEIWTYGHRNPQGMALHPRQNTIWVSEHGPQGGDELNRLRAGANYGWPVITYGEEYGGGKIGSGTSAPGMEQPIKYYVPSIATSGIDFYIQGPYADWHPSVLIGALRATHLNRVELEAGGVGEEHRLLAEGKLRFRDVQVAADGTVYALIGGDRLVQLLPAQAAGF